MWRGPAADHTRPRTPGTRRGAGTLGGGEEPDVPIADQPALMRPRGHNYSTGVHPRVAAHLAAAHPGVSVEDYRRRVLGDAVARWPEAVPAQVLRTRLAAYAVLHTDADFEQGVCAVCARWKRRTKLQPATFPARGAAAAPA